MGNPLLTFWDRLFGPDEEERRRSRRAPVRAAAPRAHRVAAIPVSVDKRCSTRLLGHHVTATASAANTTLMCVPRPSRRTQHDGR